MRILEVISDIILLVIQPRCSICPCRKSIVSDDSHSRLQINLQPTFKSQYHLLVEICTEADTVADLALNLLQDLVRIYAMKLHPFSLVLFICQRFQSIAQDVYNSDSEIGGHHGCTRVGLREREQLDDNIGAAGTSILTVLHKSAFTQFAFLLH